MSVSVLLVIPDPTLSKCLARVLARDGFWCCQARDIADAEVWLASSAWRCGAVVVDRDLLSTPAEGRLAELREKHPKVRLVALDGLAGHRGTGDGAGPFDAVVAKPFVLGPLLRVLRECGLRAAASPSSGRA